MSLYGGQRVAIMMQGMVIDMNEQQLQTLEQLQAFLSPSRDTASPLCAFSHCRRNREPDAAQRVLESIHTAGERHAHMVGSAKS